MAPRTRSTTNSPVKKASIPLPDIEEPKHIPVKVIIAPRHISSQARILSLQHPSDGSRKSFLFCAENGLFELKATTVSSIDSRSIIFTPPASTNDGTLPATPTITAPFSDGFINKDAETLTATPYNLAFILLRYLTVEKPTKKRLFQPLEDILDLPEANDRCLRFILENGQALVQKAMSEICDTIEAGDGEMFRYNDEKVFKLVVRRAQHVAEAGLPASLEERFVTRVLEAPMLSIRREDSSISLSQTKATITEDAVSQDGSFDSQLSTASTALSMGTSDVSTTSTVLAITDDTIPMQVKQLQRIRTAYDFIVATCLPSFIASRIAPFLMGKATAIDFTPLEEYVKHLTVLRAEAAASRSVSDFSRKRNLEDDEAAEEKVEKKRKQEEEEKKRKANESRGVRDLKKVDVSGMKKMSHFFTKKPAAANAKS